MERTMRTILTMVAVTGAMLVAACNTIEGAGRDLQSAGEAVSNTAAENK
jgi:predicted small secreted protein